MIVAVFPGEVSKMRSWLGDEKGSVVAWMKMTSIDRLIEGRGSI